MAAFYLCIGFRAYNRDAQILTWHRIVPSYLTTYQRLKGILAVRAMNKEIIKENLEATESKMQFILDENGELQEISKDKCRTVEYPIKYKLRNAFEVFVRVEGTENYWISNYGRCVNNLNHKDKNTFYEHKQGKCHYTVFEIAYDPIRNKKRSPDRRSRDKLI